MVDLKFAAIWLDNSLWHHEDVANEAKRGERRELGVVEPIPKSFHREGDITHTRVRVWRIGSMSGIDYIIIS